MHITRNSSAPSLAGPGVRSSVLLAGSEHGPALTITAVEVDAGSEQPPHRHPPEQAYVILSGRGRMRVGAESAEVAGGDLVWVPPNEPHGIENLGPEPLRYVSAATPPLDLSGFYEQG